MRYALRRWNLPLLPLYRHLTKYSSYTDPLEVYYAKEQQRAWERAQASHHRDLVALRAIRINAFNSADEERRRLQEQELETVRLFLEDVDLRRQKTEEEIDAAFMARNRARWNEINSAIAQLEKEDAIMRENEERRRRQQQQEEQEKQQRLKREQEEKARKEKEEREQKDKEQKEKQEAEAAKVKRQQEKAQEDKDKDKAAAATTAAANKPTTHFNGKAEFERWGAKMKVSRRGAV